VQALDAFWETVLPAEAKVNYVKPPVTSYSGSTATPCGEASNQTGPFYCPADQTVYIDVSFFDILIQDYGSSGGPLAEEYVVAHEVGHHIENLIGHLAQADNDMGADSDGVRIELEADCFAGMWAGNAATVKDPETGVTYLDPISQDQLADAMSAAAAVGDDHIQSQSGGQVDPDSFTHGTSEQRQKWFMVGYNGATVADCDVLHATEI
jgi:predicted metalloprotease